MRQGTKCGVSVYYLNSFPNQDVPQEWDLADHRGKDALIVERLNGKVIDLQSVRHVSNASAIAIAMGDDNYLEGGLSYCTFLIIVECMSKYVYS